MRLFGSSRVVCFHLVSCIAEVKTKKNARFVRKRYNIGNSHQPNLPINYLQKTPNTLMNAPPCHTLSLTLSSSPCSMLA